MEPNIDQLYKQVQENLKLPFDFELQDKQNNSDFKLEDKLEVYVSHQYSAKRVRIKSLNLVNVKRDSCSEFSTGNEKSSINEVFVSKLQQEYRVEQNKINREGNKLIQQIKKRMQMQEDIIKMRENILTLPELEKKKIILAQKRELSKPIRFDILAEHEKKYEEQKLEKQKLKEIEKIQWLEEQKTKQIRFPKSKALIRLEEELSRLKQQQLLQNEQKKIIRFNKYGEQVELPHHHSCSPIKNSSIQTQQLEIAKKNILRLQNLLGEKELFVIQERGSVNEVRARVQNSLFEINKSKPQTSEHINYKQKRKSFGIFQSDDASSQSLQMDQIKGLEQKIYRSSQESLKYSQIKQHHS